MAIVSKNEADLTSVRTLVLPDQFSILVCISAGASYNVENGGENNVLLTANTLKSGGEDDILVADNTLQNTT